LSARREVVLPDPLGTLDEVVEERVLGGVDCHAEIIREAQPDARIHARIRALAL